MQYKTIVLELLSQQTELYEHLRITRKLISTLETFALELRASHHAWKESLSLARPDSDPTQIASEALEIAVQELETRLHSVSPRDESEVFSIDQAMAHIQSHSSNE